MSTVPKPQPNIKQAVPFFAVTDMTRSVRFYVDGLRSAMKYKWIDEGKLRWCWLEVGGAAIMLQEFRKEGHDAWTPKGPVGEGVSICFMCDDAIALYHEFKARSVEPKKPFVANGMWVTDLVDPDGYKLSFESATDAPEGTAYTG